MVRLMTWSLRLLVASNAVNRPCAMIQQLLRLHDAAKPKQAHIAKEMRRLLINELEVWDLVLARAELADDGNVALGAPHAVDGHGERELAVDELLEGCACNGGERWGDVHVF